MVQSFYLLNSLYLWRVKISSQNSYIFSRLGLLTPSHWGFQWVIYCNTLIICSTLCFLESAILCLDHCTFIGQAGLSSMAAARFPSVCWPNTYSTRVVCLPRLLGSLGVLNSCQQKMNPTLRHTWPDFYSGSEEVHMLPMEEPMLAPNSWA